MTWSVAGKSNECPVPGPNSWQNHSLEEDYVLNSEDVFQASSSDCFGMFYAVQVASTVPIILNYGVTSFLKKVDDYNPLDISDPELALKAGHGLCGNQTTLAIALFESAGFQARPIEFYYDGADGKPRSHVIPEVRLGNRWYPIDTTSGIYWLSDDPDYWSLAETQEVLDGDGQRVTNAALPYAYQVQFSPDADYMNADYGILRGASGTINLQLSSPSGEERLINMPNFVGDNQPDAENRGVIFRIINTTDRTLALTVNTSGSGFSSQNVRSSLCLENECHSLNPNQNEYVFQLDKIGNLRVETEADVAYVVMDSIRWSDKGD